MTISWARFGLLPTRAAGQNRATNLPYPSGANCRCGDLCKTLPFVQSQHQVQILYLKILNVFGRLKFSPFLASGKIEYFSKVSCALRWPLKWLKRLSEGRTERVILFYLTSLLERNRFTFVPHSGQVPLATGLPLAVFPTVPFFIICFLRHLTQ
jgi:hypothetical protein